jgi:hypothetical protein
VQVLDRPPEGMARGWRIQLASPDGIEPGTYPVSGDWEWAPTEPVAQVDVDEALIFGDGCTGVVVLQDLEIGPDGQPRRLSLTYTAECPSDGNDVHHQSASSASGEIVFHALD